MSEVQRLSIHFEQMATTDSTRSHEREYDKKLVARDSQRVHKREGDKEHAASLKSKHVSKTTVYRAGTEEGPSFEVENEVWLITNPALYYPLDDNETVILWQSVIPEESHIIEEKQSSYNGITVVKLKPDAKGSKKLQKELRSIRWSESKVSLQEGGMSAIASKPLVQAILDYMYYNYPTTAEEFNFQAELKAVSHWRWWKKGEVPQFISGLQTDERIMKAASMTLQKWKELAGREVVEQTTTKNAQQADCEQSDSSSEDEFISGLREDIFCLTTYYGKYLLQEPDNNETYGASGRQSSSKYQEGRGPTVARRDGEKKGRGGGVMKVTQERKIPREQQSAKERNTTWRHTWRQTGRLEGDVAALVRSQVIGSIPF